MQKSVLIPVEQYELMLKTYDELSKELEATKKPLRKRQLLQGQSNPDTRIKAGYTLIIWLIRRKIKEE